MRHRNKGFKLGRTHAHRAATLAALSSALIEHKRIKTTLTKAKALRMYVEPLITRAKEDSTHNRREVFRHLQNKHAVTELFVEISGKVGERTGGYTRVIKLGPRHGDGAEMAMIELVDYNDVRPEGAAGGRAKRTRRGGSGGRRRGGKKAAGTTDTTQQKVPSVKTTQANPAAGPEDAQAVDEPVADEVAVPVPHRTEANAEAKAIAEEKAAEAEDTKKAQSADEAPEQESSEEEKKD
jgi:large subunit ribosomal protein L17